jgi:hypothetical protein
VVTGTTGKGASVASYRLVGGDHSATEVAGTTGDGPDAASDLLVGVGPASHCVIVPISNSVGLCHASVHLVGVGSVTVVAGR